MALVFRVRGISILPILGVVLILAEERTGNLDRTTSHLIMKIFRDLNKEHGLTLIMVTHDQEMATSARRRLMLQDGAMVADEVNSKDGGGRS